MPTCCPSPPAASRHAAIGSAALGPLNSVPERGISLQVCLGNSGKHKTRYTLVQPTVPQWSVCVYTHDTAIALSYHVPQAPPITRCAQWAPTFPQWEWECSCHHTKTHWNPDQQSSCAGMTPTSTKACQRQNPSLDDPEWWFQLCCLGVSSGAHCPAERCLRMFGKVCADSLY